MEPSDLGSAGSADLESGNRKESVMLKLISSGLAAWVLMAAASFGVAAQEWPPTGPVSLIVAAQPGSSPDLTARLVADQLRKDTGGTFVVDNRPGGLGIPAVTEVSQAEPDGRTLLIGNINTNALAPALQPKKYRFDIKSAIQPVTLLSEGPSAFIASELAPPGSFEDAVAEWRSNPGKYAYFGAGVGSFTHIWFLKLLVPQGLDLLFVPVKGGHDGYQLLAEGSVHYSYVPIASFIGQMRTKTVRTLFVTGPTRLAEFPDVPTRREVGLPEDLELNTWIGLFAPPNMPADLLQRIHGVFTTAVKRPEVGEHYKKSYMLQTVSPSPDDFKKFVDDQIDMYKAVGDRAGLKLDG